MTETQWARLAGDLDYLRALVYGACSSPLVWLPLAVCIVAGAVFAWRGINERNSYTRFGRNASLACLGVACAIVVVGTWSYSSSQAATGVPAATVIGTAPGVTAGGRG